MTLLDKIMLFHSMLSHCLLFRMSVDSQIYEGTRINDVTVYCMHVSAFSSVAPLALYSRLPESYNSLFCFYFGFHYMN